jgi:DNA-binding CsgD family transcriptional regulator
MASPPLSPMSEEPGAGCRGKENAACKNAGASELPSGDNNVATRDILVALTYGLELVRHGAMLVSAEGHLQIANSAARAILQKKDGLFLMKNSSLVADRASDTRLLQKLLHEALRSPDSGEPKDSPFSLERKQAHTSLIVRVIPGPGLECWQSPEHRTALLRLYDRDLGMVVDERALISLYGLTRGEATLAAKLVEGKSIEDAAAELFISAHTARTHLKRIFMKTDTHRQPELVVRMLLTVL